LKATRKNRLAGVYDILYECHGPQHWWPADGAFEVCVGAILTQSTSWSNVEKAIAALKGAGLLSHDGISRARPRRLAKLIRPSLYYNVKARKLKEFVGFLGREYGGDVARMRPVPTDKLRAQLLDVWGIGPETADSILLYALGKRSFVVDAYTKRIFSRLGLMGEEAAYDEVKGFFESNIPADVRLYNEYHALIVVHGKNTCRARPLCGECSLSGGCAYAQERLKPERHKR
jgi:endonuclease III related protein